MNAQMVVVALIEMLELVKAWRMETHYLFRRLGAEENEGSRITQQAYQIKSQSRAFCFGVCSLDASVRKYD